MLRGELGFQGFVISDWGSTYSTAATVNAGMDLEMPGGAVAASWIKRDPELITNNQGTFLTAPKVTQAMQAGLVSQATVDQNAGRILRVIFLSGLMEHPHIATGQVDLPAQRAFARRAAAEGIVLLKNTSATLPLHASTMHTLAVIGPNASVARVGGGGSGLVHPDVAISPLDAITQRAGAAVKVTYAAGATMTTEDRSPEGRATRARLLDEAVADSKKRRRRHRLRRLFVGSGVGRLRPQIAGAAAGTG